MASTSFSTEHIANMSGARSMFASTHLHANSQDTSCKIKRSISLPSYRPAFARVFYEGDNAANSSREKLQSDANCHGEESDAVAGGSEEPKDHKTPSTSQLPLRYSIHENKLSQASLQTETASSPTKPSRWSFLYRFSQLSDFGSEDEKVCRICHCRGGEGTMEPLLSPCRCSGSTKYVHQSCLVMWLKQSKTSICELCNSQMSIHKKVKPFREWERPRGPIGPCTKMDLWYLFVTLFSLFTLLGFIIVHAGLTYSTPETTVIFTAVYILCGIMILVRVHYFYKWFTTKSGFWKRWRSLNEEWTIKNRPARDVEQVSEGEEMV